MNRRHAVVSAFLVCLFMAPSLARTHRVRSGETLREIAKEEFGDAALADLLGLHNGLAPGTKLLADARLDLPEGRVVRIVRAQTFADLAERALGSTAYAPLLAALNRRNPKESLGFGMHVVVPALLEHRLARGEDLASVAALFYDDPGRTWALELANPKPGKTVKVPVVGFFRESLGDAETNLVKVARKQMARAGTTTAARPPAEPAPPAAPESAAIAPAPASPAGAGRNTLAQAPVGRARPTAEPQGARAANSAPPAGARKEAKPTPAPPASAEPGKTGDRPRPEAEAPSAAVPAPRPAAKPATATLDVPRAAIPDKILWRPLEEARRAVQDGDYHRAQVDLKSLLDSGRVPRDLRPQAWLLLGLSRLARGEAEPARSAFAQARKLNPSLNLDPYYYSPKVRAAFTTAAP